MGFNDCLTDCPAVSCRSDQPPDVRGPNVPNTAPCSSCGSVEPADSTGLCATPTCRRFRVGNATALTHSARAKLTATDISDRDELVAGLLAERGDKVDILTRIKINDCATATLLLQRVSRRLDDVGPTTTAGRTRSLIPIYATLSARVEKLCADLTLPPGVPSDRITTIEHRIVDPGQAAIQSSAVRLVDILLARQLNNEVLTERELGQLDILQSIVRGEL